MRVGTLILAILPLLAHAQMTRAQDEEAPFSIQDLSQREQALFLQGIGQALIVYDLRLSLREKSRLYCPPENLSLDAQTVWSLANGMLAGPHDPGIVAIAVLDQLAEKFPCGPKSKEEIELERINEARQLLKNLQSATEQASKERYADCLRSTSSVPFCDCLNEDLSWQIDFTAYERIASSSKAALNYESLSSDDRELIDQVHSIHSRCTTFRN